MEGIAKITLLKMKNEAFNDDLTIVFDGNDYEVKFTNKGKLPACSSRITNIQEFISKTIDDGWKITLMEVE